VTHWTQVLGNVALVEFVALAVLTAVQWVRRRIRGAGWVALSFAILGGVLLVAKYAPSWFVSGPTTQPVVHEWATKTLLAAVLLMPYCLFRFTTSFRPANRFVHAAALVVTGGIIAFTYALEYVPSPGVPAPPSVLAYRAALVVAFGFLFTYVVVRLTIAGRGEPPIAATRMHLLAVAVAGFQVQVVVVALGLSSETVKLVTEALSVAMGLLFLMALVLPSFLRVFLSRKENTEFRRAMGELVSATDSKDVAERLLPHVCALVGASSAALLTEDGTVIAGYPVWREGEVTEDWSTHSEGTSDRITVRAHCPTSGPTNCTSSTSWPAWWASPSSAVRWQSRSPSRPRTTRSPAWPTGRCSRSGWARPSATSGDGAKRLRSCSSTSTASNSSTTGPTTRPATSC